MSATPEELTQIINQLVQEHGEPAIAIGSMLAYFIGLDAKHGIPVVGGAHRKTLTLAAYALGREAGISRERLIAALTAMDRAYKTIDTLMALPD